ncbi:hypothetical protein [Dongia sp.]|uniref:hypothetical protein n=1 Tax=Dongia sp. TaxID=1977262 RepID=UPI0037523BAF
MGDLIGDFRRRMAPVSLRLWPGLGNPAWNSVGAARLFGGGLKVALDPARVLRKIDAEAAAALRGKFLVDGLDGLPASPVADLYTHRDMEDIARYGADWRATRLGQWLLACLAAGRPPFVRGRFITNEAEIEAYYRGYLTMFESMRDHGYRYDGDDHMCFGLGAEGAVVLVRRGTHRLAAAHILGLRQVTGLVTKIDRRFAEAAVRKAPGLSVPQAIRKGVEAAAA